MKYSLDEHLRSRLAKAGPLGQPHNLSRIRVRWLYGIAGVG